MSSCAGLLLTGGSSRRLGFDKATLRLRGRTLAERAADVLAQVCDPVVEVGPGVSGLPAVREEPAGSGPLAALVAGAEAVGTPLLMLAVDLPRVGVPLLALLADHPAPRWAAVVPLAGERSQPVCARYGTAAMADARDLVARGERSLRALEETTTVVHVPPWEWRPVGGPDAFADVDRPADVARLGLGPPG